MLSSRIIVAFILSLTVKQTLRLYSPFDGGRTKKKTQEQVLVKEIREVDVSSALLDKDFLEKNDLQSYSMAASDCQDKEDVEMLLKALSDFGDQRCDDEAAPFSVVIAPSGTGKTQLAATATCSNKWNTRYLFCESKRGDAAQEFYKPHFMLSGLLFRALSHFEEKYAEPLKLLSAASALRDWFAKDARIKTPLSALLSKILFVEDFNDATFLDLINKLNTKATMKPLVFLDETPTQDDVEKFQSVMLLRDILRAIGVCPVLMSTHTGAQNAIYKSKLSSGSEKNPPWCYVVTQLPAFHSKPEKIAGTYITPTERPLVAHYMTTMDEQQRTNLLKVVEEVQYRLQVKKMVAWTDNPIFQLCQLFRTKEDEQSSDRTTHQLVGRHFGHLVNNEGPGSPGHILYRSKPDLTAFRVQMVDPGREPVLFVALTSWSRKSIASSSVPFFPLVDAHGRAISVRKAWSTNKDKFEAPVSVANPSAVRLSGEVLEALSLASVTLATTNTDRGVGVGVRLPDFLSYVHHFMMDDVLNAELMDDTSSGVCKLLSSFDAGKRFADLIIPSCAGCDSRFTREWHVQAGEQTGTVLFDGLLKRPPNKEKRDGYLNHGSSGDAVVHIECKNHVNGIDKKTFKAVVERMRTLYKVTLLFASSVQNIFSRGNDSWTGFLASILLRRDEVAVLVLEKGEAAWLRLGEETACLGEETKYLVVAIITGPIG